MTVMAGWVVAKSGGRAFQSEHSERSALGEAVQNRPDAEALDIYDRCVARGQNTPEQCKLKSCGYQDDTG